MGHGFKFANCELTRPGHDGFLHGTDSLRDGWKPEMWWLADVNMSIFDSSTAYGNFVLPAAKKTEATKVRWWSVSQKHKRALAHLMRVL